MRMIDADALKQSVREKFEALSDRCEINELVNAAPTIDAIPVEWLQRRRDIYLKAYHAGHESEIHTAAILNDTLMAWRKEQEGR